MVLSGVLWMAVAARAGDHHGHDGHDGHGHKWGLYLAKDGATLDDVGGNATLTGVDGITLDELGFDYEGGGQCGGGAPRYDVITEDGSLYFFTCDYASHTDLGDGWVRTRFRDQDAWPQYVTDPPWPGFGTAKVSAIWVIFDVGTDEGAGYVILDDLDVNGDLVRDPKGHHGLSVVPDVYDPDGLGGATAAWQSGIGR